MSIDKLRSVYLFIGPPGSGKGTITSLCVSRFGWGHLSTGNLCRKHTVEQTDLGKQIDFALKSGKLIPDNLIVSMVNDWLLSVTNQVESIILDGYPRTVTQASYFHQFLKTNEISLGVKIVKFALSDEEIVQRLLSRYTCSNKNCQAVYSLVKGSSLAPSKQDACDRCQSSLVRRADDVDGVIRERLQMYHKHEKELLDFYAQYGYSMETIDVDKSVDSVFTEFKKLVEPSV